MFWGFIILGLDILCERTILRNLCFAFCFFGFIFTKFIAFIFRKKHKTVIEFVMNKLSQKHRLYVEMYEYFCII